MEKFKIELNNSKKEKEKFESSKTMEFSSRLLEKPIKSGQPGYDKIFALGKVSKEGNIWRIDVNSEIPTVVLDQKVNDEFGLKSPLVKEARNNKIEGTSLISGGSFVWIDEGKNRKLILLKRDKGAPVDAGSLTGPAGRCGELPSHTTVAETNEELMIVRSKLPTGESRYKLLGFYRDESGKDAIIDNKLRQIEKRYNALKEHGKDDDAKLLRLIRGAEDIEMLSIEQYKKSEGDRDRAEKIITYIDGKEMDLIENGTAYFDEENNTLEIREIIDVKVPDNSELVKILDGENFGDDNCGRDIILVSSLKELQNEKLVPSLMDYLKKSI